MRIKTNLKNIIEKLGANNFKFQKSQARYRINSIKEFQTIIDKERARADRNNLPLSLVLFQTKMLHQGYALLHHTIDVIVHRMRSTDEVGWFDHERIGVILPDTSVEGATKFTHDICKLFVNPLSPPICEIYSYPSKWVFTNGRHHHQFDIFDNLNKNDTEALGGNFTCNEYAFSSNVASHEKQTCSLDNINIDTENGYEFFFVNQLPLWKRIVDIIGSLFGIMLLSPLMITIAIAIKLSTPGSIIFRQNRIGYRGRPFEIYKFRSMTQDVNDDLHAKYITQFVIGKAEKNSDGLFKLKNDPRVTPIGRFLRRWSLDELPQFFNVLKGDMSLVGPRPEPCYVGAHYSPWQYSRNMEAKPGITGQWQVDARNRVTFEDMIRMDINYCRSLSFVYDIKLIFRTFLTVLVDNGAY